MTVYPVSQVRKIFRIMQQGKHQGKMVLSFSENNTEAPVLCPAKNSLKLDPDATYLIVGGLGGLGRSSAMEIVASSARHLAFVSRSSDSKPEAREVVDKLQQFGTPAHVYCGDIAPEASFQATIDLISKETPPIKRVLQMAMILRDIVFEKMSYEG